MKNYIVTAATVTALLFASCEEKQTLSGTDLLTDNENAIVTNDAMVDNLQEAADYEVDYLAGSDASIGSIEKSESGEKGRRPRYVNGVGPAITVNPAGYSFPKTITIDYGDGIELVNGRVLRGIIVIEVSAPIFTNGATRTVTYQNFYIDSTMLAGGGVCTFTGTDSTQRIFSHNNDITITFADGSVLYRHGERTRTLAQGFETIFDHTDDLIMITGFVTYHTDDETTFGKTIIEPLVKTGGCRYIVSGTVEFNYNNTVFASLDYGDGNCDDIATITKNGETRQITLERRRQFPWL